MHRIHYRAFPADYKGKTKKKHFAAKRKQGFSGWSEHAGEKDRILVLFPPLDFLCCILCKNFTPPFCF
jgi:hypothetical protein